MCIVLLHGVLCETRPPSWLSPKSAVLYNLGPVELYVVRYKHQTGGTSANMGSDKSRNANDLIITSTGFPASLVEPATPIVVIFAAGGLPHRLARRPSVGFRLERLSVLLELALLAVHLRKQRRNTTKTNDKSATCSNTFLAPRQLINSPN